MCSVVILVCHSCTQDIDAETELRLSQWVIGEGKITIRDMSSGQARPLLHHVGRLQTRNRPTLSLGECVITTEFVQTYGPIFRELQARYKLHIELPWLGGDQEGLELSDQVLELLLQLGSAVYSFGVSDLYGIDPDRHGKAAWPWHGLMIRSEFYEMEITDLLMLPDPGQAAARPVLLCCAGPVIIPALPEVRPHELHMHAFASYRQSCHA